MRVRRLLLGIVTAAVSIIAVDRLLARLSSPLPPAVAGTPTTTRVGGTDVAVTELGDPDGDAVVFVHGPYLGASSREFADLARSLPDDRRLLLIDLPGFGRSDRPPVRFDLDRLTGALIAVLEEHTDGATLVASGQALPIALAAAEQTKVDCVVSIGPRAGHPNPNPVLAGLLEVPVVGTAVYLLVTSRVLLTRYLAGVFELPHERLSADHVDYAWQSAHQSGSRAADIAAIGGDLDAVEPLDELVSAAECSMAFIIGSKATNPDATTVRSLAEIADATVSTVSSTGAFPHVTAPDTVARHLEEAGLLTVAK